MSTAFDTVIDRRNTSCLKYDFARERGRDETVLPLWVADMDFRTAPCVLDRLKQAVEHGIFGYTDVKEEYFQAVSGWYRERFGWEVKRPWLVKTPGVVFALAMAVKAFTEPGDGVLLQQPVYYPFLEVIQDNGRVPVNSPLRQIDGHYEMDFAGLEEKIVSEQVKLFLLCSPHNPVGRVWTAEELRRVGEICRKHGVIVVSDEIHSDFTFSGHTHHVFASVSPEDAENCVICTAPSKTFNLAGLQISNIFIPNQTLRRKFRHEVNAAGYSQPNAMGLFAAEAAYTGGQEWLEELKAYLKDNLDFLRTFLRERLPEITLTEPEGTYLIWLDFRSLGLTEAERVNLIEKKAGLWLDSGAMFGADGEGFERINIACPRSTLRQALLQMETAIHGNP